MRTTIIIIAITFLQQNHCLGQLNIDFGPVLEFSSIQNEPEVHDIGYLVGDDGIGHAKLNYQLGVGYRFLEKNQVRFEFNLIRRKRPWIDSGVVGYNEVEFGHTQYHLKYRRTLSHGIFVGAGMYFSKYDDLILRISPDSRVVSKLGSNSTHSDVGLSMQVGIELYNFNVFGEYYRGLVDWSKYGDELNRVEILRFGVSYSIVFRRK